MEPNLLIIKQSSHNQFGLCSCKKHGQKFMDLMTISIQDIMKKDYWLFLEHHVFHLNQNSKDFFKDYLHNRQRGQLSLAQLQKMLDNLQK